MWPVWMDSTSASGPLGLFLQNVMWEYMKGTSKRRSTANLNGFCFLGRHTDRQVDCLNHYYVRSVGTIRRFSWMNLLVLPLTFFSVSFSHRRCLQIWWLLSLRQGAQSPQLSLRWQPMHSPQRFRFFFDWKMLEDIYKNFDRVTIAFGHFEDVDNWRCEIVRKLNDSSGRFRLGNLEKLG